ncbi:MAG: Clp protease N-terminal domain-containing protein [Planctomycetota bacterium]
MTLQIAYWFNPLLWLIRKQLQNLRELCCDATVAKILREKTPQYRETLLETARQLLAEPVDPGLGLLGLFENSNWLLHRLHWLEKKTWKHQPLRVAAVFTLVCLMAACVMPMTKFDPGPPAFTIRGAVTDAETGLPIAGAKVGDVEKYAEGKQCTTTDSNGHYEYKTWYEEHGVKAEANGYKLQLKGFNTKLFGSEKEKVIDFELTPERAEREWISASPNEDLSAEIRNILSLAMSEARIQTFRKTDFQELRKKYGYELVPYLLEYIGNEHPNVRWHAYVNIWALGKFSKDVSERQKVVDILTEGLTDETNLVKQSIPKWLLSFQKQDFSVKSREILSQLIALDEPDRRAVHFKGLILVVGVADLKSELSRLEQIIDQEKAQKRNHPLKSEGHVYWNALRARARMGIKEDILRCVETIESCKDEQQIVTQFLNELSYIRQPEIVEYIHRYLVSDKRVPPVKTGTLGTYYYQYAADALAEMLVDFPVKKYVGGYSKEEIEQCRKWMSKQKTWDIIGINPPSRELSTGEDIPNKDTDVQIDSETIENAEKLEFKATLPNSVTVVTVEQVMKQADREARLLNHEYIGTEHLLLALTTEKFGLVPEAFEECGFDRDKIHDELMKVVKPGYEPVKKRRLSKTPRAKKALEFAAEEAKTLNSDTVKAEHVLLGLMRVEDGVAAQVLMNLGLDFEKTRQLIIPKLTSDPAGSNPDFQLHPEITDPNLFSRLQNLVEVFFKHNYHDITARKTIRWEIPAVDANGNMSIRYKYEAVIWDKDKIITDQLFVFDKDGKLLSYDKISPYPVGSEQWLREHVGEFFKNNYRDVTARKTIEWGDPQQNEDSSYSIRYKYGATIWDKDTIVANQVFTFGKDGKFISAENLEGFPQKAEAPNEFKATLPNGITVELVGVCEHPSQGKQWWRPDGSLLEEAPYDDDFGRAFPRDGDKGYKFAVKYSGMAGKEVDAKIIPTDFKTTNGGALFNTSEKNGKENTKYVEGLLDEKIVWIGAAFDEKLSHCDIRIGVCWGDWKNNYRYETDQPNDEVEWATFKNVSLKPNFKTNVQIEVENQNETQKSKDDLAAELVRNVRTSEQWIHKIDSLYLRLERTWAKHAEPEEKFESTDESTTASSPPTAAKDVYEYVIAPNRLRFLSLRKGQLELRIWDGNETSYFEKYPTGATFVLSNSPDRIFAREISGLNWLRSQPHSFWWNPFDPNELMDFYGRPEDFHIKGEKKYHGINCYLLEYQKPDSNLSFHWYVGRQDGLLYGITSLREGRPRLENWTLDYKEVAGGCLLPRTQGHQFFEWDENTNSSVVTSRSDLKVTEVWVNKDLDDDLFRIQFGQDQNDLQPAFSLAQILLKLDKAVQQYLNTHDDKYPGNLTELQPLLDPDSFSLITERIEYLGDRKHLRIHPSQILILAYDRKMLEQQNNTNVLFDDGRIEFMSAEKFKGIQKCELNKTPAGQAEIEKKDNKKIVSTVCRLPETDRFALEGQQGEQGTLSGIVVDESGKPMEGVLVDVWTWYPGNETHTGPDGKFSISGFEPEQKTVEVRFSKEGFSPRYIFRQPLGIKNVKVILNDNTYFEGKITGPDGRPAANAVIKAIAGPKQAEGVVIGEVLTQCRTDEKGNFRLYVQPDSYDIKIRADKGLARLSNVVIADDEAKKLSVILNEGITFKAKVIDSETDRPIKGLRLFHWKYPEIESVSDSNGLIQIPEMQAGSFDFLVDSKDYCRWWSQECISEWNRYRIDDEKTGWQRNFDYLDFDISDDLGQVTIIAEKGVKIKGKALDPDGNAVKGATVTLARTGSGNSLTGDTRYSFTTDDDGNFEMMAPAGKDAEYNLLVHDGKYEQWRNWANGVLPPIKTVPGETVENIVIRLNTPATVKGRVINENGSPLPNHKVRAHAFDKLGNRYYDPAARTDEEGNFEIKFIRPGKHYIQAYPFWLTAEQAPADTTKVVEVEPAQTIEGIELTTRQTPINSRITTKPPKDQSIRQNPAEQTEDNGWLIKKQAVNGEQTDTQTQITIEAKVFSTALKNKAMRDFLREKLKIDGVSEDQFWVSPLALTDDQSNEFCEWMKSAIGTTVLTSPKVRVFDGEKTEMSVTSRPEPSTGYTGQTPKKQYATGVEFEFTPRLRKDKSLVLLNIKFKKTDLARFPEKADKSGNKTDAPALDIESVNTVISVPQARCMLIPVCGMQSAAEDEHDKDRQTILLVKTNIDTKPEKPPVQTEIKNNEYQKRYFVTVVAGENDITFNDSKITEDQLESMLENIPNRESTVFEVAFEPNIWPKSEPQRTEWLKQNKLFLEIGKLTKKLGFEYLSVVGPDYPASRRGPVSIRFEDKLEINKEILVGLQSFEEKPLLFIRSAEFIKNKGEINATLKVAVTSWPKKRWEIGVRLLDEQGHQIDSVVKTFENSGIVLREALTSWPNLQFSFGEVDLSYAKKFEVKLREFENISTEESNNAAEQVKTVEMPIGVGEKDTELCYVFSFAEEKLISLKMTYEGLSEKEQSDRIFQEIFNSGADIGLLHKDDVDVFNSGLITKVPFGDFSAVTNAPLEKLVAHIRAVDISEPREMFRVPSFRNETVENGQIAVILTGKGKVVAIQGGQFDAKSKKRELQYIILGQVDINNLPEPQFLVETGKWTPNGMVGEAAQALARDDLMKAQFLARHAAELQPELADAFLIQGMVYAKTDVYDKTQTCYEKALELYKAANNFGRQSLVLKLLRRDSETEAIGSKIEAKTKEPIPAIHNGDLKPMDFILPAEKPAEQVEGDKRN